MFEEDVAQGLQRRYVFGGPLCQAKLEASCSVGGKQLPHAVDTGVVGEMDVIEQDSLNTHRRRPLKQRREPALHRPNAAGRGLALPERELRQRYSEIISKSIVQR